MLGIYLHIPFCVKKCFYCDFYSIETAYGASNTEIINKYNQKIDDNLVNPFLSAIRNEIKIRTQDRQNRIEVDSIFLGGGTPSLLSENQITSLFQYLYDVFKISPDSEITIECNPGTLSSEKLKVYKEIGINRLSIGVQSFIPDELKFLQRIHTAGDVINSFQMSRDFGFDNISLDLIFSIPGQSKESLIYSLSKAVELQPDHISAYSLIFEKGTPLYNEMKKGKIKPVDEKTDSLFYETVIDFLADNGFNQYEVSNFAKNGKFCNHNLKYWHNEEFLAFGPSAHGFYDNIRYKNKRNLKSYINILQSNKLPSEYEEFQNDNLKIIDTIFLGLRSDGIDLNRLIFHYNLNLREILEEELVLYKQEKLIIDSLNKISLTKKGYKICDSITVDIITKVEKFLKNKNSQITIN